MKYLDIESVVDYVKNNLAIDGIINTDHVVSRLVYDDDLIFIINFSDNALTHLISVDNASVFNKESQCPIHFTIDMVNEKLLKMLKYLRTKKGAQQSATFDFDANEFGYEIRDSFYKNY